MKLPCNVIKDLMLLYENGEASEETRRIVEEHIGQCSECRSLLHVDALTFDEETTNVDNPEEIVFAEKNEVQALKNGLGKIKKKMAMVTGCHSNDFADFVSWNSDFS